MAGSATAAKKKAGTSSSASSAKTPAKSSGPKIIPAPEKCPNCTVGIPAMIAEDENGAAYKCGKCGLGYTHPATAEAQKRELTTIHPHIGNGQLRNMARRYGVEPDDYDGPEGLRSALIAKGEKG